MLLIMARTFSEEGEVQQIRRKTNPFAAQCSPSLTSAKGGQGISGPPRLPLSGLEPDAILPRGEPNENVDTRTANHDPGYAGPDPGHRSEGFAIDIVSTGGTGTHAPAGSFAGVTEIQPGSYVVMDAHYGTIEGIAFDQAIVLLTSIISKQRPSEATVDCGMKAASGDSGPPVPRGLGNARFAFAGDEHGKLLFDGPRPDVRVGDKVELLPSHCDTTIALHDVYYVARDGVLEDVWPIAARGRME
jgi:hypothetical protein